MFAPLQMLVLLWIASCNTAFGARIGHVVEPWMPELLHSSPPYVAISPMTFTLNRNFFYGFQFTPHVHQPSTFGMKVLARFEDALLHYKLYLELHPFCLILNTPGTHDGLVIITSTKCAWDAPQSCMVETRPKLGEGHGDATSTTTK